MKMITSTLWGMREFFLIRASSGYTTEAQKLERKDSKINLHLLLKAAAKKKARSKGLGAFNRWILAYII